MFNGISGTRQQVHHIYPNEKEDRAHISELFQNNQQLKFL